MKFAGNRYDVFISHAGEDKDIIARPLAQKLADLGLKVWFDEFTLQIGDNLRESIDKGLLNSDFGIVILSKFFFSKNWPKRELDGLVSLSTKILPIWHDVNSDDVIKFSPMLASIFALSSSSGIDSIASKISRVVIDKPNKSAPVKVEEHYDSPFQKFDNSPVLDIQSKRFRFLLKLYQKRDRTKIKNNIYDIQQELGYSENLINEFMQYYKAKGYLERIAGDVEITIYGMDFIEGQLPNSQEVKNVKSNRDSVLRELYKERESYWGIEREELAKRLHISDEFTIFDMLYYLEKKQLISPYLSKVRITPHGIDHVESYLLDS